MPGARSNFPAQKASQPGKEWPVQRACGEGNGATQATQKLARRSVKVFVSRRRADIFAFVVAIVMRIAVFGVRSRWGQWSPILHHYYQIVFCNILFFSFPFQVIAVLDGLTWGWLGGWMAGGGEVAVGRRMGGWACAHPMQMK